MKFYLLSYSCLDKAEFGTCSCSFLDIAPEGLSFNLGSPLPVEFDQPIEYYLDEDLPLDDYAYANMFQFLVSPRLGSLVAKYSTCYRVYPSHIFFRDRLISSEYVTINFECSFRLLDWKNSEYGLNRDFPDRVRRIKKLMIDKSQAPKDDRIFRLYESTGMILVSDLFRREYEELGLTGMKFLDIDSDPCKLR